MLAVLEDAKPVVLSIDQWISFLAYLGGLDPSAVSGLNKPMLIKAIAELTELIRERQKPTHIAIASTDGLARVAKTADFKCRNSTPVMKLEHIPVEKIVTGLRRVCIITFPEFTEARDLSDKVTAIGEEICDPLRAFMYAAQSPDKDFIYITAFENEGKLYELRVGRGDEGLFYSILPLFSIKDGKVTSAGKGWQKSYQFLVMK